MPRFLSKDDCRQQENNPVTDNGNTNCLVFEAISVNTSPTKSAREFVKTSRDADFLVLPDSYRKQVLLHFKFCHMSQ